MKLANGTSIDEKQFDTWLKALRSGNYKQTRGALQTADGFCCLGVACQVLIPKDEKVFCNNAPDKLDGGFPTDQKSAPKWLVEINDDFTSKGKNPSAITWLNDNGVKTFSELADILEKTYKDKK